MPAPLLTSAVGDSSGSTAPPVTAPTTPLKVVCPGDASVSARGPVTVPLNVTPLAAAVPFAVRTVSTPSTTLSP